MTSDSQPAGSDVLLPTIGSVLGRVPSGLFIVTAGDDSGRETAMLASWVQQASFDPPMVTVAVNRERWIHDWLVKRPQLAVCLLAATQRDLLKRFGKGFGPDEPAFTGVEIVRGTTGLPLLAQSLGALEGTIAGRLETGDHVIYAVEITGAKAGPLLERDEPLVHIRKNGLRY